MDKKEKLDTIERMYKRIECALDSVADYPDKIFEEEKRIERQHRDFVSVDGSRRRFAITIGAAARLLTCQMILDAYVNPYLSLQPTVGLDMKQSSLWAIGIATRYRKQLESITKEEAELFLGEISYTDLI